MLTAGVITSLNLSFNEIDGSLAELLPWPLLGRLRSLSLTGNYLCGNLPRDFECLKAIEEVQLGTNQLAGELPATMGALHLPSLRVLVVSNNLLFGSLDVLFAADSRLRHLDVSSNGFSDHAWRSVLAAAKRGMLSKLSHLQLENNAFEETNPEIHRRLKGVLPSTDIRI
jgi:hypothetical protein